MPLRFFRRIRIAPGVSVNLSKSGASVSVGPKGAKMTVGPRGVRKTVVLPGTGVYYTTTSPLHDKTPIVSPIVEPPSPRHFRGFWGRRSLKGKAAIVVLGLLLVGALNPTNAAPPGPASNTIIPLAAAAASPNPTPTPPIARATPAATPEPTPEPTVAPTAKPTPKPTPKPTSQPATLTIRLTRLTSPVNQGAFATLSIRTLARASCSIEVDYASGASTAKGLSDKTASSTGAVSWTWKVGPRTSPGTWPIYVSCYKGDLSDNFDTEFRVR